MRRKRAEIWRMDVRGLATWAPGGQPLPSPRVAGVCLVNLSSRELGSSCRVKGWQVVREEGGGTRLV